MPPVRTVPAAKSMQSQVIAHTSPIRRPVANIIETKSGRSRLTAFSSYVRAARSWAACAAVNAWEPCVEQCE